MFNYDSTQTQLDALSIIITDLDYDLLKYIFNIYFLIFIRIITVILHKWTNSYEIKILNKTITE